MALSGQDIIYHDELMGFQERGVKESEPRGRADTPVPLPLTATFTSRCHVFRAANLSMPLHPVQSTGVQAVME